MFAGATAPFDVKKAYQNVHRELSAKYPGHILPASELQWVFINAGGFMTSVCVVHASLTENIFFFGTAMDTSGHSGSASFSFIIIVVAQNFFVKPKLYASDV